jgi:hypothetical protein
MIHNIVSKLSYTGSMLDKKKSWERSVLSEEKFDDIRTRKPEEFVTPFGSSVWVHKK